MEFWKHDSNVKTEQSTAMRFYSYKVQNLVKILEIMSALILVFWSTTRLPIALKLLIEFAKQTCALLLTTPSVFLIGNAIVVTIVAQSGTFHFQSPSTTSEPDSKSDLYDEFVTESHRRSPIQTQEVEKVVPLRDSEAVESEVEVRRCRRTQSERGVDVVARKELRRSRTEKCGMKMEIKTATFDAVDDLSGDEFRRRVEAFIAKQQRFIRDENMALVISN